MKKKFSTPASRLSSSLSIILGLCWLGFSSLHAQTVIHPANDGFELPNLGAEPASAFKYFNQLSPEQLQAAAWTFKGSSGIAANGSFFNLVEAGRQNNDGKKSDAGQAGFLTATGSFSQSVADIPMGSLTLTFGLEARSTDKKNNPVEVFLDGKSLGTFTPADATAFKAFTTSPVDVSSGSHTIAFVGTAAPGSEKVDPTTFIDNVSLTVTTDASGK